MKGMASIALVTVATLGVLITIGVYEWSGGYKPDTAVTYAQARAALAALYDARDDADALCALAASNGNCRALLDDAGAAPAQAPTIVCSVEYAGDSTHARGLIVRVHTEGVPEDTESLVLNVDGEARLMNPVYWNGARVGQEPTGTVDGEYHCA